MFPHCLQNLPQIDQTFSIQMKGHHRAPSCGSQTDYAAEGVVPGEMIGPNLISRMEKRGWTAADRVNTFDLRMFVAVAALASPTKIGQLPTPTF